MTAGTPASGGGSGRRARGIRAWADRAKRLWWVLPGRDRIAVQGLLLAAALLAAAWRAGSLGMVQADFVLTFGGGLAAAATLFRGAVYRPQPAPPPAGPLVAPSEEVRRHAAREAGAGPAA